MDRLFKNFIAILLLLASLEQGLAQNISIGTYESKKDINNISKQIGKSYERGDDISIAKNYEDLAQVFLDKLEYSKAEEYLKKSLVIYADLGLKDEKARVYRNLAKLQEQQGRTKEAAGYYGLAKNESTEKEQALINSNDAQRVQNSSNTRLQNTYSDRNLSIFKKEGKNDEIADLYWQQAKTNASQSDTTKAIQNYNYALGYAGNSSEQIQIKNELADIYANTDQTDKAKEIKKEIITEAQKTQDVSTEIKQKQSLANIYFKEKNHEEGIRLLQESYDKALESSNTLEAKKSLELMIKYYRSNNNYEKSIQLYDQFLKKLETLVRSDSSLMDTQLLASTEEKIKQLEKEKSLQDELITRKNTFNYFLVGAIILIVVFLLFLVKAFFSVKNKNKEIALQSLRREMNPHFIFNSLNSVNQFIAENKEMEANKYLSSYSNLMRNIMENSNKDFISLSNEIELIKKYLDLEHLRFKDKFDYKLIVDEKLDADSTFIPNMIIQPQLENAIWHGLRYKNEKGLLEVKFALEGKRLRMEIHDDGIGLTKSKELKTQNQKSHTSRGLNNTIERVKLLNELYQTGIEMNIIEKATQGTLVEITFPLINKT